MALSSQICPDLLEYFFSLWALVFTSDTKGSSRGEGFGGGNR